MIPQWVGEIMSEYPLFASKFDNHIFYDLSRFSLAGIKNECMNADLEFSPKTMLKIKEPFH